MAGPLGMMKIGMLSEAELPYGIKAIMSKVSREIELQLHNLHRKIDIETWYQAMEDPRRIEHICRDFYQEYQAMEERKYMATIPNLGMMNQSQAQNAYNQANNQLSNQQWAMQQGSVSQALKVPPPVKTQINRKLLLLCE